MFEAIEGGFVLQYWSVARTQLAHRRLRLAAGTLDITTEVIAELPVPPGRTWSVVNGRHIPTG